METSTYPDGGAHWQGGGKPAQQLLYGYAKSTKLFRCPTHSNPHQYAWWAFYDAPDFRYPDKPQQDWPGSSYMFSEWWILGVYYADKHRVHLKASDVVNPSRVAYMSEGWWYPNGWSWITMDKTDSRIPPEWTRLTWSHNKEVNLLWGDGSVSRRPTKDIAYEVRSCPIHEWSNDPNDPDGDHSNQ